jgi:hypothetical protein
MQCLTGGVHVIVWGAMRQVVFYMEAFAGRAKKKAARFLRTAHTGLGIGNPAIMLPDR